VAAVDPVAIRVLPLLLRYPRVTPNAVTSVAFVVGAVSILAFAGGHFVAGALLYELRFFLDCLDGKIARVRGVSSPFGAAFDQLADLLTIPTAYASIGLVLAHQGHLSGSLALLPALLAALVAVAELSLAQVRKASPDRIPISVGRGPGRLTAWMRRHRLTARPWTVEAETAGLVLGPILLAGRDLAHLEMVVAGVYAVFLAVDVVMVLAEAHRQA
jgi:phosphatidylglycerophosphate synthase